MLMRQWSKRWKFSYFWLSRWKRWNFPICLQQHLPPSTPRRLIIIIHHDHRCFLNKLPVPNMKEPFRPSSLSLPVFRIWFTAMGGEHSFVFFLETNPLRNGRKLLMTNCLPVLFWTDYFTGVKSCNFPELVTWWKTVKQYSNKGIQLAFLILKKCGIYMLHIKWLFGQCSKHPQFSPIHICQMAVAGVLLPSFSILWPIRGR